MAPSDATHQTDLPEPPPPPKIPTETDDVYTLRCAAATALWKTDNENRVKKRIEGKLMDIPERRKQVIDALNGRPPAPEPWYWTNFSTAFPDPYMPYFTPSENWRKIFRYAPGMLSDFIGVYHSMLIHLNADARPIRGIAVRNVNQRKQIQDTYYKFQLTTSMLNQLLTFIRGIMEEMISQEPTLYKKRKDDDTWGTLSISTERGITGAKVAYMWTVMEQQVFDRDWTREVYDTMQASEIIMQELVTKLDKIEEIANRPPAAAAAAAPAGPGSAGINAIAGAISRTQNKAKEIPKATIKMTPDEWKIWKLMADDHVADYDIKCASSTAQMLFVKAMFTEDFWTRIVALNERLRQMSARNRSERDNFILWATTDHNKGAKDLAEMIWQECNAASSAVIQVYEWHTMFIGPAYQHKWTIDSCDSLTKMYEAGSLAFDRTPIDFMNVKDTLIATVIMNNMSEELQDEVQKVMDKKKIIDEKEKLLLKEHENGQEDRNEEEDQNGESLLLARQGGGQSRQRPRTPTPLRGGRSSRSNSGNRSGSSQRGRSPKRPAIHHSWLKGQCTRCAGRDHDFKKCPRKRDDFKCSGAEGCGKTGDQVDYCMDRLLKKYPYMANEKGTAQGSPNNSAPNASTRQSRPETRQPHANPPPPRAASASEQNSLYFTQDQQPAVYTEPAQEAYQWAHAQQQQQTYSPAHYQQPYAQQLSPQPVQLPMYSPHQVPAPPPAQLDGRSRTPTRETDPHLFMLTQGRNKLPELDCRVWPETVRGAPDINSKGRDEKSLPDT